MTVLLTIELYNTWHDGDSLEGPQHSEGPQTRKVADFHTDGSVARRDDNEVEPIPRVPQVRVLVQYETLGDGLDDHLCRVDSKEYVPETRSQLIR